MPMMRWNSSLSVNVDAMDMQHQKLVKLTNQLFDAMKVGKGKQAIEGVLRELASYTKVHFAAEEKLMQEHNFPGLAEHKAKHQQLLAKVSDFCKKYNAGELGISINLCDFLQDWLKVHISQEDKQYGVHIASQTAATV
jgi:hemerythrin-like metal-binding protein